MTLKDISPIIKKSGNLMIVDRDDCQWIGDGAALYPLYNFPKMSDEALLKVLSLENEDITVTHSDAAVIDFDYEQRGLTDPDGKVLKELGPVLIIDGVTYISHYTIYGAIVTAKHYYKPIERDKSYPEDPIFYFRTRGKRKAPYIVAKKGLIVLGYIMPLQTTHVAEQYARLSDQLRLAGIQFWGDSENEED